MESSDSLLSNYLCQLADFNNLREGELDDGNDISNWFSYSRVTDLGDSRCESPEFSPSCAPIWCRE